jgi:cell division protein FtsZ
MSEDLLNFGFQPDQDSMIKVIGVGGGGGNAVKHMCKMGITGVDFIVCNTDAQALENSPVPVKIQLGVSLTEGRGAGNKPRRGEQAAIESLDDLKEILQNNTRMVFITAGMGGGTGTGAAPVIARVARENDILTIAVVTLPSKKEGKLRFQQALEGAEELKKYVDSMLVISNENLHSIYGDLPATQAFAQADNILATAVKGCAEIITLHGNINIDFADVNTVMRESGVFIMGSGIAEGEGRALCAVKEALVSPLLDSNDIFGTDNILLNITSGEEEIRMGEIGQIIDYLQDRAGDEANIIWGNGQDSTLGDKINVTIIATGFTRNPNSLFHEEPEVETVSLLDEEEPELVEVQKPVSHEPKAVLPEPEAVLVEEQEAVLSESHSSPEIIEQVEFVVEEKPVVIENREVVNKAVEKKQKRKEKKDARKAKTQENGESVTNWFVGQMNSLFSDNDMEIEE